jgi:hypothetical protein
MEVKVIKLLFLKLNLKTKAYELGKRILMTTHLSLKAFNEIEAAQCNRQLTESLSNLYQFQTAMGTFKETSN